MNTTCPAAPAHLRFLIAAIVGLLAITGYAMAPRNTVRSDTRPNIVLIVVEDLSPRVGAFGDPVAQTPHLDRLAGEGVRFTNVFTSAGVCAPSRAALITGMHQASIGAQHMRTASFVWDASRSGYEAVPPPTVKAFPEYLRASGYFTVNNVRTDYQFGEPFTIWDETGPEATWTHRAADQPFFAMYSQTITHESRLFAPDNVSGAEGISHHPDIWAYVAQRRGEAFVRRTDPAAVSVPPYYPDTPAVRADIARQYDNVQIMDAWVGERMEELRRAGVLDNTIVIWTTDHGDGLPRGKRSLYDSGLRVPMIVRFPDGRGAGTIDERMISFVDLAPTILSLANAPRQPLMQGEDFFSAAFRGHAYVFAARDRFDAVYFDKSRAVRSGDFKYIRNYNLDVPFYGDIPYRDNNATMRELRRMHSEGTLNAQQSGYFKTPRPSAPAAMRVEAKAIRYGFEESPVAIFQ